MAKDSEKTPEVSPVELSPKARHEVAKIAERASRKREYKESGTTVENENAQFGFARLENGYKVKVVRMKKPIKSDDKVVSLEDEVFGKEK